MNPETLPTISRTDLDAVIDKPLEFIFLFVEKYYHLISSDPSGQIQQQFTLDQNILMAFSAFDDQVSNGGFIQLIENGYGTYIFDSPLSEYLNEWGAIETARIIDEARVIYHHKKEILEREKTLEEFAKLYQEHKDFEVLEDQYDKIITAERAIIKDHIKQNINRFAIIS